MSLKRQGQFGAVILLYHRILKNAKSLSLNGSHWVSLKAFERQMRYVQKEFDIVALDVIVETLVERRAFKERLLSVTFDDGYDDVFQHGVPLLNTLCIPAAFFVTTGLLDQKLSPWWEKLYATTHRSKRKLSVEWWQWFSRFRLLPRKRRVAFLQQCFDSTSSYANKGNGGLSKFIGWKELEKLKLMPRFSIHSHTASHESLASLTRREIRRELLESKHQLQRFQSCDGLYVAYPFGAREDVDARVLQETEKAGYRAGLTAIPGVNKTGNSIYVLRRIGVNAQMDETLFKAVTLDPERFFPVEKIVPMKR